MIYLDYAAATPLDSRVFKIMKPFFAEQYGNASSIYQLGQKSRKAIDDAREICLKLLGAKKPSELIFTGSGTESCNMAIFGTAFARQKKGKHILVSAIEHSAILEPARYLMDNFGFELTELKPDASGIISPEIFEKALRQDTIIASIIYANNEIGVIQPIKKLAKICKEHGILFHTDACQAPGFLDINVEHLGLDLMTLNSSKVYGPKGVGLLYIREGLQIAPHIIGGGQEFRMRGGTENPALILGFAKALELTLKNSKKEAERIRNLKNKLLDKLLKINGITLNGSTENRLPNNINIYTPCHNGETLVMRLDLEGLAASSGSACSSGKTEASHVLMAIGQSEKKAKQSLRLTLGRHTNEEEIKKAAKILKKVLA